jgi:hypothetical protein
MTRLSQQELWAETAELAERFGWSLDAILDLEHGDRHRLLATRPATSQVPSRRLGAEVYGAQR